MLCGGTAEKHLGTGRITKVLAATDGSSPSEHAVRVAQVLARGAGADLEVFRVESGIPGVEIVRRGELSHADLVVLGRRQRDGASPSQERTTDMVVRRRSGVCLMIPPNVTGLDRMLIALDGTRRGLAILQSAAAVAGALGAEMLAICVVPGDPDWSASSDPAVARVASAVGSANLRVRRGNPVREILAELEESGANLLVLGVRRGGPPGEMGSGHIGQDLLRESSSAILTVPI